MMDNKLYLKKKFPEKDDEDIEFLLSSASSIYRRRTKYPTVRPEHENWILRCAIELAEREDFAGANAYSENGVSFSFDGSQISYGLLSELPNNIVMYDKKGGILK